MEQASLDQFVDRLVEEKGFPALEPEVLEQIKSDLRERLENRINAAMLEAMPQDKLPEFDTLLDSGTPEAVQQFCRDNIPNLDEVVASALMDFRRTYISA